MLSLGIIGGADAPTAILISAAPGITGLAPFMAAVLAVALIDAVLIIKRNRR